MEAGLCCVGSRKTAAAAHHHQHTSSARSNLYNYYAEPSYGGCKHYYTMLPVGGSEHAQNCQLFDHHRHGGNPDNSCEIISNGSSSSSSSSNSIIINNHNNTCMSLAIEDLLDFSNAELSAMDQCSAAGIVSTCEYGDRGDGNASSGKLAEDAAAAAASGGDSSTKAQSLADDVRRSCSSIDLVDRDRLCAEPVSAQVWGIFRSEKQSNRSHIQLVRLESDSSLIDRSIGGRVSKENLWEGFDPKRIESVRFDSIDGG
jgi:hypothetical protein